MKATTLFRISSDTDGPIARVHFDLKDVLAGLNSLVLHYTNQKGTRTGEFMDLGAGGKVTRVVAHYSI